MDDFIDVDWHKVYSDEIFAEISEKLRDKPGLYENKVLLLVEQDSSGKLIPKLIGDYVSLKIASVLSSL